MAITYGPSYMMERINILLMEYVFHVERLVAALFVVQGALERGRRKWEERPMGPPYSPSMNATPLRAKRVHSLPTAISGCPRSRVAGATGSIASAEPSRKLPS